MKRKIILSSILIVSVLTSAVVYTYTPSISDKEFLFKAGFKNIPEFSSWERDSDRIFWNNKYKLKYITY